jgi:HSF-type DNA-binding
MLGEVERRGPSFADVVSWQEGGKSFKVHDGARFASQVLPRYFNQTKFKSFQRQLNMYGFRRIQHGKLKGGYVHKSFVRGKPELSGGVKRQTKSQTKSRKMAVVSHCPKMDANHQFFLVACAPHLFRA